MRPLEGKELKYFKKNYFTEAQKTLCKRFEQVGGSFTFRVDGEPYKYKHDGSKAYTDYIEQMDNRVAELQKVVDAAAVRPPNPSAE